MRTKFYILYYFLIAATLTMFVIIMKRHEKREKAQTREVYHYEEPRDWNEETLRGNKRETLDLLIEMK